MKLKGLVKQFLLDNFTQLSRKIFKDQILICGKFSKWEEAKKITRGYDHQDTAINSFSAVKSRFLEREERFERDGFILKDEAKNLYLSEAIKKVIGKKSELKILDFGGGFGSLYFNNRSILPKAINKDWLIFELDSVVKQSKRVNELKVLKFTNLWKSVLTNARGRFVIFSGVLQYLEDPRFSFEEILKKKPSYIFLDRTPFLSNQQSKNRLCIQINPQILGSSSYPLWLFRPMYFSEILEKHGFYRVMEFQSVDKLSHIATWRGEFWVNKNFCF